MNDRIRFARYPGPTANVIFAPLMLGVRDGVFRQAGIDVEVIEPVEHPWAAVATGDADIGVSYVDYWFHPEFRGRFALIGVHEVFGPGSGLTTLLARSSLVEEGRIRDVGSVAGKRIALLPNRGDDYMIVHGLLEQAGLGFDAVTLVNVPHRGPERVAALSSGAVDIVIGRRPTDIEAEVRQGVVTRWLAGGTAAPGLQARFLVASAELLSHRRGAVTCFLAAYMEATLRFWEMWEHPDEVSRLTGDTAEVLEVTNPPGFPVDLGINLARLDADLAELARGGLIHRPPAAEGLVDLEPWSEVLESTRRGGGAS